MGGGGGCGCGRVAQLNTVPPPPLAVVRARTHARKSPVRAHASPVLLPLADTPTGMRAEAFYCRRSRDDECGLRGGGGDVEVGGGGGVSGEGWGVEGPGGEEDGRKQGPGDGRE